MTRESSLGADQKPSRLNKDLAKSLRVERISDKAKNQKFQGYKTPGMPVIMVMLAAG